MGLEGVYPPPLDKHTHTHPAHCMLGYTTPALVNRITDRFKKHYLPATSFAGGKYVWSYGMSRSERNFAFAFDFDQCEQPVTIVSMLSLPGAETVSKRQPPGQTSVKVIVMVNALDNMCKKITIRL